MTSFDGETDLPSCVVTERWQESIVVVSCAGVLDMVTAPTLQQRLTEVLDKQPSALVIDLTEVEFLASHGMNVLANVRRQLTPDIEFAVVADGVATSRPLRLVGLAELINMCPSLDEALEKVGVAPAR